MIGLAVFLISQTVYALLSRPLAYRINLNRRMKMVLEQDSRDRVFVELMKARGLTAKGRFRYPTIRRLNRLVVQSGLTIGIEFILGIMLTLSLLSALVMLVVFYLPWVIAAPAGLAIGVIFPLLYLMRRRNKRRAAFANQLPEALELIARSLRAGHPLQVALSLAAREFPDPLGSEFGILSDEIAYGYTLPQALRNLEARVGQEDLTVLATGIIIQSEVGGNLIELIGNLSTLLRDRVKMRRRVRVLTSEGRFSGYMLSAIPFIVFAALNLISPQFYGDIWGVPVVKVVLTGAVAWMALGNYVIYRMVNFRF